MYSGGEGAFYDTPRGGSKPKGLWRLKLADAVNLSGINVMNIDDSNTIRRSAEIFLVQAG